MCPRPPHFLSASYAPDHHDDKDNVKVPSKVIVMRKRIASASSNELKCFLSGKSGHKKYQ